MVDVTWWQWTLAGSAAGFLIGVVAAREALLYRRVHRYGGLISDSYIRARPR